PFFPHGTATSAIYTLSLHDALPISPGGRAAKAASVGAKTVSPLFVFSTCVRFVASTALRKAPNWPEAFAVSTMSPAARTCGTEGAGDTAVGAPGCGAATASDGVAFD